MNKRFRIKRNEEFAKLISYHHCVSSACFIIYYQDKSQDNARVGISVSKKIGNAVVRNRVKRQIREMVRELMDFATYPKDLVIIVRKPYLEHDYHHNKNDLEIAFKKAII